MARLKNSRHNCPQNLTEPPPLRSSPDDPRAIRMQAMEVSNQGAVKHIPGRYPGTLLRTIPLPVHEVLKRPPNTAGIQEPVDRVGGMAIDESRRRWRPRSRSQWGSDHWAETGDMEGRVDPHRARELQSVGHRVDPAEDFEGTNEPGRQLPVLHPQWKIPSREPDPLTRSEGDQPPTTIGLLLVLPRGFQQGSSGSTPCTPTPPNKLLG